ncbi:MAG: hypothetical protein JXA46_17790 [Dehalococcoidales bacterium]|nr:hypothetical protein [Dehalococcoidales bacterium]
MEEKMLGLIPVLKKPKSFGRWDTCALIITDQRAIFAQITGNMLKDAVSEAQRKGKEEGKGFLSRWADQLKATLAYSNRYWDIPPDKVLGETPWNFAISNQEIKLISIKQKSQSSWGQEVDRTITEVRIESHKRKDTYNIDTYSKDMVAMLKGIYGDRVKA